MCIIKLTRDTRLRDKRQGQSFDKLSNLTRVPRLEVSLLICKLILHIYLIVLSNTNYLVQGIPA